MSHTLVHTNGETISPADIDRSLELLRQSVNLSSSVILQQLSGNIMFEDLSPELQQLLSIVASAAVNLQEEWVGDGTTQDYTLGSAILSNSDLVSVNGLNEDTANYVISASPSGINLHFTDVPMLGDKLRIMYKSLNVASPIVFTNFTTNHDSIEQLMTVDDAIYVYGNNIADTEMEIAKYRAADLMQEIPPVTYRDAVPMDGNSPDYPAMISVGSEIWAAGFNDGSIAYTNRVSRFNADTLAPTAPSGYFEVTSDTGCQIADLATDGTYVYAFMKGGTYIAPNHIAKVRIASTATVGVINSGLNVTGDTNMIMSNNGYLYVAFKDPSVYQVRKYNVAPASGFVIAHHFDSEPAKIVAVDTNVYVLEGYNLQKIDDVADTTELLTTFAFVGSTMDFDGTDLWIASGDTLYKCNRSGVILQTVTPVVGQTIKEVKALSGFIWATFDGNHTVNVSKIFPGLPNI